MSSSRSERARAVRRRAGRAARAAGRRPQPPPGGPRLGGYFLRFGIASVALFALYRVSEATGAFRHVNEWNAAACAGLLRAAGIGSRRAGTVLELGTGGLQIINECSAIYVLILFTAAVLAFPAGRRVRAWGLAVGIPCILAVNLLRLVTLGVVVRYRSDLLPFFHEYLWQVLFVLVVAVLYLAWIEIAVRRTPARSSA